LKVQIPEGTVITDHDGEVVRELGITPIPLDRPPFPTIGSIMAPLYFTVQPGGATLSKGARVIYPNNRHFKPGTRMEFCYYEPEEDFWEEYGKGSVSEDGMRIVPDPGVVFDEFTGALQPPPALANFGDLSGTGDGDPVDLGTGLFDYRKTDLHLPGPMPISLTRFYRPGDSNHYDFGIGMLSSYHSWLYPQPIPPPYQAFDVILPGERRVHFSRISPDPTGINYKNAVYSSSGTPGPFFDARARWNDLDSTWVVSLRDGSTYVYGAVDATLHDIVDRFGNRIVVLGANGTNPWPIRQIVSYPSGRWVNLTYTGSFATSAKDDLGRQVTYSYTNSELRTVLDAKQQAGTETTYTWSTDTDCSPSRVITSVKDPRQITFITNTYGTGCRVADQTVPTSTGTESYLFSYTVDGQGHVTQTQVTDPNENLRVASFDASGYLTSDVQASGTPSARTFTYEYDPSTHLLQAVVDGFHSRRTAYAYFTGTNDLQSVTRLAGTGGAVTTSYTYEPVFHQLDTVTDPLNHVTDFDYDAAGCLDAVTDAANRTTTFDCNDAGQITSLTDPLTHATQFAYKAGDLVSVTDPLGRISRSFSDAGGRVLSVTDPLNHVTRYEYSDLNQLTKISDAAGKTIAFDYDADGNLRFVRDQRGAAESTTEFTYNNLNLPSSRIDPIAHAETFTYDDNGNLTFSTATTR